MGRINVTIRIFVGTSVPNLRLRGPGMRESDRGCRVSRSSQMRGTLKNDVTSCLKETAPRSPSFLVIVLAQDHCYRDLLRFMLTADYLFSPCDD